MSIVELLLDTAREDTNLLRRKDEAGDIFDIYRTVDFLLKAEDQEKAETVSSFINDNRYGEATVRNTEDNYHILVKIDMPINQNIICSVSGLFTCISKIFGVDYDGWGSITQKYNHKN